MTCSATGQRPCRRCALGMGGAMLVLAASSAASAQELRGGAEVRLSGEVVSNPYLETGDTQITGALTAEVRPWLRQQNELTTFNLSGFVQARQFAERYELEDNYGVSGDVTHRASERLTLTGEADVYSSASRLSAVFPGLSPNPDEPVPGLVDPDLIGDPTLLGQRGRSTVVRANLGSQYVIDERNELQLGVGLEDFGFSHANGHDYRTHRVDGGVMHVVDETTSVGANLSFRQTDYADPAVRDARFVTVMGSVTNRLDERWTLEASVGASTTVIEASGPFARTESTSASAAMELCRREEGGQFCLEYRRQPQPTGLGQVRNTDLANLSYSVRSGRNRLGIGASYSRSGQSEGTALGTPGIEFVSIRATLERAFNERVSGFVSASTSRVFRSNLAIDPQVNIGLGVSVRLGRLR